MAPIDLTQSLDNLVERDDRPLRALASIDDPRRAAFRPSPGTSDATPRYGQLRDLGAEVPPADGPRLRVRAIIWLARLLRESGSATSWKRSGRRGSSYEGAVVARSYGDRGRRSASSRI
jgi:hypothetical protein